MKLDTKQAIVDFKGVPVMGDGKEITIGDTLSLIITQAQSSNPLKAYVIGKKLATEDEIELDESDALFLKDIIKENKTYGDLVRGQLLSLIK